MEETLRLAGWNGVNKLVNILEPGENLLQFHGQKVNQLEIDGSSGERANVFLRVFANIENT